MAITESVTLSAPAKLNLFLEVGGIRGDGYHDIDSVMQSVSLCDTVTVEKREFGIYFECNKKELVYGGNLAVKAAKLFFEELELSGGAFIYLQKRIPVSAGLGGGSTDAAAVLTALDVLYDTKLSLQRLIDMGRKLGADVPFCIKKGLCRASGIGDRLTDLGKLPECLFLIGKGSESVSTKEAYALLDGHTDRKVRSSDAMTEKIKNGDLHGICRELYNCFDRLKKFDDRISEIMLQNGAYNAMISGSGPSVIGLFKNKEEITPAYNALTDKGYECYICGPEYNEDNKK